MRYVELRRHTDNDGDRLTPRGVADAELIGRDRLHPPYAAFVSTGAARATQMLEILRNAAGQDAIPVAEGGGRPIPGVGMTRKPVQCDERHPLSAPVEVVKFQAVEINKPGGRW